MNLIDKDALVAEIEKLKSEALQKKEQCKSKGLSKIAYQIGAYNKILSILDTLEVSGVGDYVAGYKAAKEECLEPYQLGFNNGKERTIDKACESYCKVCRMEGCKCEDCIWLNRFKEAMKGEQLWD